MQAVILAGGMGTRLKPVAGKLPKSLVKVAGRPFIEHQLELLAKNDIHRALLCVGYQGKLIEKHLGDGAKFDVVVEYSYENADHLLGTGGALVNALPYLDESFMVIYGDSYLPMDYQAAIKTFRRDKDVAMMCVHKNEGKWDKSNVRIADNRVVFYSKGAKPGEADYIDYGMTLFHRSVIEDSLDKTLPLDMARVQQDLVRRCYLAAYVVNERFYEIGKPEGLAELDAMLKAKK